MQKDKIRRLNTFGLLTMCILVLGAGGWASTTNIAGAVIAPGEVIVESQIKLVQHPAGGIVGELLVTDGDTVEAGDVVIRLDGTVAEAELAIVAGRLDEFYARRALLIAERDGLDEVILPDIILSRSDDPRVSEIIDSTLATFALRRLARVGQVLQLEEQILQLEEQVRGLQHQQNAKQAEYALVGTQIENYRRLREQGLIEIGALTALERDEARLQGEIGQLAASLADAQARIAETELGIIQVTQQTQSDAASALQELDASIAEHEERRITALDQLRRLDIAAPQTGIVHEMSVHTVGGVIAAGEPLMQIVPVLEALEIEAKASPIDRDRLHVGQTVSLTFSAFNPRATPRIDGEVRSISPSTLIDEISGAPYYLLRILLSEEQVDLLGDVEIVPGMIVTAFVQTEPRTVMQYLLAPVVEQVSHAFRGR